MGKGRFQTLLSVVFFFISVAVISSCAYAGGASALGYNSTANVSINVTQYHPPMLYVGNTTTFSINITDTGSANLTNYTLSISYNGTLLNLTGASPAPNASSNAGGNGTAAWHIALLQPGASAVITANLTAQDAGSAGVLFTVGNASNATAVQDAEPVTVQNLPGGPSITLTKSLLNSPVAGGIATFEINISDNGTMNYTNITLQDYYNKSFINFTASDTATAGQSTGYVSWRLNLSAGQNRSIIANFTTYSAGGDVNKVNATNATGAFLGEASKPFGVAPAGGGGQQQTGPGLVQFGSSIKSPYLFYNEGKVLSFELVRQTGSSDCLVNLTITLPTNVTFNGTNATTGDAAFAAEADRAVWSNSSGFFCGNDTGFQGSANFTLGLDSTHTLGPISFALVGYKNDTNHTREAINLTAFSAIRMSYAGRIYNSNRTAQANATASVSVDSKSMSGQVDLGTFSAQTDAGGFFNITGIPSLNASPGGMPGGNQGPMLLYKLSAAAYNDSSHHYAAYVGPSLPDMPEAMFKQMLSDPKIYLTPAVTFRINVLGENFKEQPTNQNMSGTPGWVPVFPVTNISFGYVLSDSSLNFDVSQDTSQTSSLRYFSAPLARNYSLQVFPSSTFPIDIPFDSIGSRCNASGYNISQTGVVASCTRTGDIYLVTATVSAQMRIVPLNGTIHTAGGAAGFDSTFVIPYMLHNGNNLGEYNTLPHNMGVMMRWPKNQTKYWDTYDPTTGDFTLYLPASEATSDMMLAAYAKKGSTFYEGLLPVTAVGQAINVSSLNITVYPLAAGTLTAIESGDVAANWNQTNVTNTTEIRFNLVSSNGTLLSTESPFVDMQLSHDGISYSRDIGASSGTFSTELFQGQGIDKLTVYSQDYAPLSRPVSASEIHGGVVNITLDSFSLRDPDNLSKTLSSYDIRFFASNATCDVPYPPAGCELFAGNKSNFSPMKAILYGDISFRMSSGNITIHYVKTDLLASGPPNALFSQNATSGGGLSQAWKFGSSGPDIYDKVIIGFPYNASLGNKTLKVKINLLYDADFNVIWNSSVNTTAELAGGDYSDYLNTPYEAYLNGTGVVCSDTDANLTAGLCYKDNVTGTLWIKIPHFSGVGPSVSVATTTGGGSSGGNTGGSSGGTSGGGGGTVSGGLLTSVPPGTSRLSHMIAVVAPGTPTKFDFSGDAAIPVQSIMVTTNKGLSDAEITVTSYDSTPSGVTPVQGRAFRYLSLDESVLTNADLSSANISFRVEKGWLANNSLTPGEISLMHYVNGTWVKLDTALESSDAGYYYFTAATPGFSYFAIAAQAPPAPTTTTTTMEAAVATTSTAAASTTTTTAVPANPPPAQKSQNYAWIWYLVGVLVIGSAVYLFLGPLKK